MAYNIDGLTTAVNQLVKQREDRLERKEHSIPDQLDDNYRAMFRKMGCFFSETKKS